MAAQGKTMTTQRHAYGTAAYWLAAGLAVALSLAAALFALFGADERVDTPRRSPAADAATRAERIGFFEARLSADPFDAVSLNALVSEYLQRARETGDVGDYNRALSAANRSLELLPDYFPSLVAGASAFNAVHDFAGGLALADRAIAARPGQAAGHALRGDALVALGRYEEAAPAYQLMLSLEPGMGTMGRLAHLSFLTGDLLNAEDFWRQAVDLSRSLPAESEAWARTQLALLHFERGDLSNARAEAGRALRAYPQYPAATALQARVDAANGDFDAAIVALSAVTKRQPLVEYIVQLGETYLAGGRAAEAERQFALVDAIDALYRANGVNTDTAIALFYANHDRSLDKAMAMAEAGYRAAPGIYAADALAWALYNSGRLQDAARYSDEALRFGTPDASLLFHGGMIQKDLGNDARALELLERALRVNRNFSPLHAATASAAIAELRGALGRGDR